jgi:hypothetical protein
VVKGCPRQLVDLRFRRTERTAHIPHRRGGRQFDIEGERLRRPRTDGARRHGEEIGFLTRAVEL